MKKVIRFIVGLVALLVILAAVGVLFLDSLAKTGVEKGVTFALEVPTTVESLSLSLMRGRLDLNGLKIDNPKGFKSGHFIDMKRLDVELEPKTILAETIRIRTFELDGLDINIEQGPTGSNVDRILESLKRFGGPEGEKAKDKAGGKKVHVDRIVIRNVVAHYHFLPGLATDEPVTVEVPEIVLNDVTSDDPEGVVVSELVSRVLPVVLAAVADNSQGAVPSEWLSGFDANIDATATALDVQDLMKQLGGLGKTVNKFLNRLESAKPEDAPKQD